MIRTEGLNIHLGEFHLQDITLGIKKNEFFVLMGPTGAGKTVLLEAIVGLVATRSGKIFIEGHDITGLPPERRGISIVYQDYALFPHLNVEKNITYGVHFHLIDKDTARNRFSRLIDQLNISNLLNRYPGTLSGGELQRVALARALMVSPKVILLDEPLSALDPNFREEIRHMLKTLHETSHITFLMVTHDFAEALSLGDRAAIMNRGRIEQTGCIQDIFNHPESTFVADFVGMKNIFSARFSNKSAQVGDLSFEIPSPHPNSTGYLAVRPEDIIISHTCLDSSMRNMFKGTVGRIVDQGFSYEVHVISGGVLFKSLLTKSSLIELGIKEGLEVFISFKASAVHIF